LIRDFKALTWPQGYKKGDFHEPKCVNVPHGLLQQGGQDLNPPSEVAFGFWNYERSQAREKLEAA